MDLMVIENLFFNRNIGRVYDLKGSSRSRYNTDTSGSNKVLLDTNLVERLRTEPIFLGSKAKRSLERAIWNDTSFLAVSFLFNISPLYVNMKRFGVLASGLLYSLFWFCFSFFSYCNKHQTSSF